MFALCSLLSLAHAHPFSQTEFSLRTSVKISEKGIVPLVALKPFRSLFMTLALKIGHQVC